MFSSRNLSTGTPLIRQISTDHALEIAAVCFSIAFTLLYLRNVIPQCYVAALLGSVLFTLLCWRKRIFAESALHVFYAGMAVYGFFATEADWQVSSRPLSDHLAWLFAGALGTLCVGYLLSRNPLARTPYLDAFTSVFSLIATWLMISYVHENWLYWMVIDSAAIALYAKRGLYLSAALFVLYLAMALDGYFVQIHWFS